MEENGDLKIAPDMEEIEFVNNRGGISCVFNRQVITYKTPPGMVFSDNDEFHKKAFQSAIAFSSKSWQLEQALNKMYGIHGTLETKPIETITIYG